MNIFANGFSQRGKRGTATISLSTTAGYATPSTLVQSHTVTVSAPALTYAYAGDPLGKDEQGNSSYISLGAPAPAGGVTVHLESSAPSRLLLAANNATTVGAATLDVVVPAGQSSAAYALQALADNGNVTVTATAPGYTDTSASHPLYPSGFYIATGNITTTTFSANTDVSVCTAALVPVTLTPHSLNFTLRPGVTPVDIFLSSDTPSVGIILNSPRTLTAGQKCTYLLTPNFQFDPVGAGTATISLSTPAGYATPSTLAHRSL